MFSSYPQIYHSRFPDNIIITTDALREAANLVHEWPSACSSVGLTCESTYNEDTDIDLVDKHLYLGHKIGISKDNQIHVEKSHSFGQELKDFLKSDIPNSQKKVCHQCILPFLTCENCDLNDNNLEKSQSRTA